MEKNQGKVKLTNNSVGIFIKNAEIGQRLYDSDVSGFYLRKLKSGGFFYLYYKTEIGKPRIMPIGKFTDNTCDQARNKAKKLAGYIVSGEDIQETRKEVRNSKLKTAREYIEITYRSLQSRKKTGLGTIHIIETFFAELLDKAIAEIDQDDILRWQSKQESRGVKFTTIKRRFNPFKAMLNHATSRGYIDFNPVAQVRLDSYPETEAQRTIRKSRRTYLTVPQMQNLLNALDQYQDEKRVQRRNGRAHGKSELPDLDKVTYVDHVVPIMLLLLYTGFRSGDAFGLRWDHVNFNFSIISKIIEKTEHKTPGTKHFPISLPLLDVLRKWHQQNSSPEGGLVFPSPRTGDRLDNTALQSPWKKIKKYAGLPSELQLYSLRHNFASHLVMNGCDLLGVAKLLGHSDIQMIVEHYGHLHPSLLQDYSTQFSNILEKSDNKEIGAVN